MSKHFAFFFILTLLLYTPFFTLAKIPQGETTLETDLSKSIEDYVGLYNQNIEKFPNIFITFFGNERINLYVNKILVYGLRTENGKIVEKVKNGINHPTLNVYTTKDALINLSNKDISLKEALGKGDLKYSGVGFFKKIKFGIAKIFQNFFIQKESPKEEKKEEEIEEQKLEEKEQPEEANTCQDGTTYEECGITKPLYCKDGALINNCGSCGCEENYTCQTDGTCAETQPLPQEFRELTILNPSNGSTVEIYAGLGYGYEPVKIKVGIPKDQMSAYIDYGMLEYRGVDIRPTEFSGRRDKVPYGGNSFNPTNLSYGREGEWVPLYCLKDQPICDSNTGICEYEWYTYHLRHGLYELRAKLALDVEEHSSNTIALHIVYPTEVRGMDVPLTVREYGGRRIMEGGEVDIRLPISVETYVPKYAVQSELKIGYKKVGEEEWITGSSYEIDWPPGGYDGRSYVRGLYYLPYPEGYEVRAEIKEGWGGKHYSESQVVNIVAPDNFNPENNIHLISPREENELKTGSRYDIKGICPDTLNYSKGVVEYKKTDEVDWGTFGNPLIFTHYHKYGSSYYVDEHICELTPWMGNLTWFRFNDTGEYNMRLKVTDLSGGVLYSETMTFRVTP